MLLDGTGGGSGSSFVVVGFAPLKEKDIGQLITQYPSTVSTAVVIVYHSTRSLAALKQIRTIEVPRRALCRYIMVGLWGCPLGLRIHESMNHGIRDSKV